MKSPRRNAKTIITNDKTRAKKPERKKTVVTIAKAKKLPLRPSKYVGVTMHQSGQKKWQASICIHGKKKSLGYFHDEKEAARIYDEQAILLGKPVNFPLHEGMEQAVKQAPKGSPVGGSKPCAKASNADH